MTSYEYVLNNQGIPVLVQISGDTSETIQNPDDVQDSESNVLGSGSSLVNEVILFGNTTGDLLKNSNTIISEGNFTGLQKITLGSVASFGSLCLFTGDDNIITISAPAIGEQYTLILPPNDGDAGQQLTTDGTGILTWTGAGINDVESALDFTVNDRLLSTDFSNGVKHIKQTATILDSSNNLSVINDFTNTGIIRTPRNIKMTGPALTNVVLGFEAGDNLSSDQRDTVAIGYQTLETGTTSTRNVCVGFRSFQDTNSSDNVGIGFRTGESHSTGVGANVYIGHQCGAQSSLGSSNVGIGHNCMNISFSLGNSNICIGAANSQHLTGSFNLILGAFSGESVTSADNNTFLGNQAGVDISVGDSNILVGSLAGDNLSGSNSNNILIGSTGINGSNAIRLGTSGTHTSCNIAGIRDVSPAGGSNEMMIMSSTGFIGTDTIPTADPNTVTATSIFGNNNRLIRSNGTSRILQTSGAILSDGDVLSGLTGLVSSGNIDFNTCTTFDVRTTQNSSNTVNIIAGGGPNSTMLIQNDSGTLLTSIIIESIAGGIQLDTEDGTNIATGGFSIAGNPAVASNTAPVVTNSVLKYSGTTGALASESGVIIDGSNNMTGLNSLTTTALTIGSNIGIACDTAPVVTNSVLKFSGTTGGLASETNVIIDGSNNMTGVNVLTVAALNIGTDVGVASTTLPVVDESIVIYDGVSGRLLKRTDITIDSSGNLGTTGQIRLTSGSFYSAWTAPASTTSNLTFEIPNTYSTNNGGMPVYSNSGLHTGWQNISTIKLPQRYIDGFNSFWNSAAQFTMGTFGETSICRDSSNTQDIEIFSNQSVQINVSGINGLSATFSEAISTSYDVYVIHDSAAVEPTAYLMMPEGTDPLTVIEFTSGGYTHYRKVMWVRNAGSGDFLRFIVGGKGRSRVYSYDEDKTLLTILSSGSATAWTNISLAAFKPPESEFVQLRIALGSTVGTPANGDLRLRPDFSAVSGVNALYTVSPGEAMAANVFHDAFIAMPSRNRQIEYEVSTADIDVFIYITGFAFEL